MKQDLGDALGSPESVTLRLIDEAAQKAAEMSGTVEVPRCLVEDAAAGPTSGRLLARRVNAFLRRVDIRVSRASRLEATLSLVQDPGSKRLAIQRCLAFLERHHDFDLLFENLADELSRKTLEWFVQYSTAYAFLGTAASRLFPPKWSNQQWQSMVEQMKRAPAAGSYVLGGLSIACTPSELAAAFIVEQYRLAGIVEPHVGDYVVDCGAYMGDTALWFAAIAGRDGHVFAMEPSPDNGSVLESNIRRNASPDLATIDVLRIAAGSRSGTASFADSRYGGSCLTESGSMTVQVESVDNLVKRGTIPRVDFIKMDIEGGELEALEGCRETIKSMHPRLAICIYHKPTDPIDIPALVLSTEADYRFYVRHESPGISETVLFAAPVSRREATT